MKKTRELPCISEDCTSSDGMSIEDNGWGHCFVCNSNFPPHQVEAGATVQTKKSKSGISKEEFTAPTTIYRPWKERGFTKDTIEKYRVQVGVEGNNFIAKYPRYDEEGNHVGNKVRMQDGERDRKKGAPFLFEGDKESMTLFGMHAFEPGCSQYLTITEGQDDAMAAYQMSGSKYPCISVDGASSAAEDIQNNFEWINSFENIVLAFDSDDAGRKAVKAVLNLPFPIGKVKVLTMRRHKDANEYLLAGESETFVREWWQAPVKKPDGLKMGTDMWQEIIDRKENFTVKYPFEGLNDLTFGLRLSEMVVLTADTGIGKTSIIKAIEHKLLTDKEVKENNYGVGFLHLEEPNGDTALGLLSVHNRVPYHIPGIERPQKDLRRAYDELLNNDRS